MDGAKAVVSGTGSIYIVILDITDFVFTCAVLFTTTVTGFKGYKSLVTVSFNNFCTILSNGTEAFMSRISLSTVKHPSILDRL